MWRTALAISLAAAIALLSVAASAQTAGNAQCGVVYYTVTKTYTKVQTVTAVDEVVTYTTATAISGNTTITSLTPVTTTTTRTLTTTLIDVEPGGMLANFTCTWVPPPTLGAPPVSAPGMPTPRSDFVYLLLASAAFGVFALALVYDITKIVIFLAVSTAAIWIMASAYTPLAPLAAGLTALTAAFILAAAFFKR